MTNTFKTSKLIDGFFRPNKLGNPTFDIHNFDNYKSTHGFYMHLHGSPLFYEDQEGNIAKLKRHQTTGLTIADIESEIGKEILVDHLVLCNLEMKERHIVSSNLLHAFFEAFKYRIRHSKKIIIFGYGGEDAHINNILRKAKDSLLYIIEDKKFGRGFSEWKRKFPKIEQKNYFSQNNILSSSSCIEGIFEI